MKALYHAFLVLLLVAAFSSECVYAQAPQYSYIPNLITSNTIPLNSASNLRQNLYYPSDFNAPSGMVDKIYIGAGTATAPSFNPLTIKMGPTTLTSFTAGPYITGLTTVFSSPVTLSAVGGWYEVLLSTPYYYDNTLNLIIEVSQSGASGSSSTPMASNTAVPSTTNRTLYGSSAATSGSLQARLMQMGLSFAPLSLKLNSFSAVSASHDNLLYWSTSSEKEISKFVIERSFNGEDFTAVGEMPSKGASQQVNEYQFTDKNASVSIKTYYRLKIEETNGSFFFSPTVQASITPHNNEPVAVFPVPFTNAVFTTVNVQQAGEVHLKMHDISGKQVATLSRYFQPGVHTVQMPGLATLPPGAYIMVVEIDRREYRLKLNK